MRTNYDMIRLSSQFIRNQLELINQLELMNQFKNQKNTMNLIMKKQKSFLIIALKMV